jgi:hypothetical protein
VATRYLLLLCVVGGPVTTGCAEKIWVVGASAPSVDAGADVVVVPAQPAPGCGGRCRPGQLCRQDSCIDDCRSDLAVACAAPAVCDFLTGRCVPPGQPCLLTGTPVACGTGEFPPRCGPGSRCHPQQGCLEEAGCKRVVCDASNFCRGADCSAVGGGVRDVSLAALADAPAGAPGGIAAQATVAADSTCGLSVTFELRQDLELNVSAYNDQGIWRVPLSGPPSRLLSESEPIGGLAADRTGTLYYALADSRVIRRVRSGAAPEPFATVPATDLGSLARMTFGPDGQLYAVSDRSTFRFSADGVITQTWTLPAGAVLTGLVFDRDGALLVGEAWPGLWRLPPGGGASFSRYLDATGVVPDSTLNPWNEGMALGPDGIVHVGIFPSSNDQGIIYRIMSPPRPERVLGLAEMRRDVPATRFAGIHGLAFGVDGSLYFVNQNTDDDTREPLGQVLALRPSGAIDLVASGLNFDWLNGFDGDIVVSQATVQSVSAPVNPSGRAAATLDAPTAPGTYGIRLLVTDPRTGAIREARGTVRVR